MSQAQTHLSKRRLYRYRVDLAKHCRRQGCNASPKLKCLIIFAAKEKSAKLVHVSRYYV